MSKVKAWSVLPGAMLGTLLSYAICQREAEAQGGGGSLAPLQCFEIADDLELAETSAIDLCAGATSAAPAQCLAAAIDVGVLTTQQMIQLCRGSTSMASFSCFDELDAIGTLTDSQMVAYCGSRCPLGPPPPEAGNPQCFAAAVDLADLSEQMGAELCLLASSAGPVDCFVAGEDVTELAESQLLQLCAQTPSCQYMNAPAATAY